MDDAVDLRDRGFSGQRLRDKLSALYPGAYHQSIRALADRSIGVRQAVREVLLAPPTQEIYEFAIPLVEGAPKGITATFTVEYTPPDSRVPMLLHAWVEEADALTVAQLGEIGAENLERGVLRGTGSPDRLRQWLERQRLLAAQGDEEAQQKLQRFRARLDTGSIKITAIMKGR